MSGIGKPALFREEAPCRPVGRTRDKQLAQLRPAAWRVERRLRASCCRLAALSQRKGSSMPLIRANAGIVTQINVLTVPEGGQQALIDHLTEAARFARDTPGWLSSSLHRSLDGTRVVNYAQSESPDAARRVVDRLRGAGLLDHKGLGEANPVCTTWHSSWSGSLKETKVALMRHLRRISRPGCRASSPCRRDCPGCRCRGTP
jgi:Antibiotic biosynthesis monooxygenase